MAKMSKADREALKAAKAAEREAKVASGAKVRSKGTVRKSADLAKGSLQDKLVVLYRSAYKHGSPNFTGVTNRSIATISKKTGKPHTGFPYAACGGKTKTKGIYSLDEAGLAKVKAAAKAAQDAEGKISSWSPAAAEFINAVEENKIGSHGGGGGGPRAVK